MDDILICGMEMPARQILAVINPNGLVEALAGNTLVAEYEAVPVPPHGRLIDVDKVFDELAHNLGIRSLDYLTPSERAIVSWFRDAPTVIPASEEYER